MEIIKLNRFEAVAACTFLPTVGLILTTLFSLFSLFVRQSSIVYKAIVISYIACITLLVVSLLICELAIRKSKKEFVLFETEFKYINTMYQISQIESCTYYVCKWYAIPFVYVYKHQLGGLINIRLDDGRRIKFNVLYKDYLKIKKRIGLVKEQ